MRTTLILDSTQISTFYECEEMWNLRNRELLTQIEMPDAPELKTAMGTLGHKLLEIYYTAIGSGSDAGIAARLALDFNPTLADKVDQGFPLSEENQKKVFKRFEDYLMFWGTRDYQIVNRSRNEIRPSPDGKSLTDIIVSEPVIEKGFSYPLLDTKEYLFVLEGRLDFVGVINGELLWMDHKWQLRERELYKKSIQFRNYALVTGFALGVVNYVRLHDKLSPKTFVRQPISFSPGETHCWKQELIEKYIEISKTISRADFALRRDSCAGKFGYPCEFTKICEEYNPVTKAAIKENCFKPKKEWKPW